MDLRLVGTPDLARVEALAAEVREHTILEDVVRWAIARDHELDVIPMDEFSYDVLSPVGPDLVLVYDTT